MAAEKKLWRNRKEKKEWARRLQADDPGVGSGSPAGGRNRFGQRFPLRGRTSRPENAAHARLRVFYRGLISFGRLVA
jgi:hypothetical protein